ncbi:polysaccharide pyruvyl transferase [Streptomyces sp. NRRL F-4489]|uniref:polysaccharide pyruvyl transferase family protein n=1 Tax=Streptomyces sp. NRRL F-4489 TaxID=1609095 RepID=UPI00074B1B82|nr:polysaccharide pyruvyl transferase family protein [Streptomyces sp. NRRL F-4489]KUL36872.1 polysaccharide pyruvyl transferase [Streptomyces sp. NRRL F-4489]
MTAPRVLLTGWFSFLDGEVTAGDALAAEVVGHALRTAGLPCDTAWSPAFRPGALHLDALDPARYTHLVFACGPVHSREPAGGGRSPLLALHDRFPAARRIAVGVSVPDPDDSAVRRFHTVLPRDGAGRPAADLSLSAPVPPALPLVGVVLTGGQHEYGARRRHAEVSRTLGAWLVRAGVARLALDTRLDSRDWRLPATPDELHTVLARLDAVVTTRLHGLVLALRAGTPALAVDPVAGGAKVSAQAAALGWPAVLRGEDLRPADFHHWLDWCLSDAGRARALAHTTAPVDGTLLRRLLDHLPAGERTGAPAHAEQRR